MRWLKALFGHDEHSGQSAGVRHLTHPNQLRTGDIIKFKFMDISESSGKQFEIHQINTYLYGNMCYPEMILKDRDGVLLYMSVEDEDGEEYLCLSKKIGKAHILDVISAENLDDITSKGVGHSITIQNPSPEYKEWLSNRYTEVDDNVQGAFIKGDGRELSDQAMKQRESFTSFLLESEDEEYALELEVYSSGERELCATRYFDIEEIDEMWPQQTGTH